MDIKKIWWIYYKGRKFDVDILDENLNQGVKDYIITIPRIKRHYLQAQTICEFKE